MRILLQKKTQKMKIKNRNVISKFGNLKEIDIKIVK